MCENSKAVFQTVMACNDSDNDNVDRDNHNDVSMITECLYQAMQAQPGSIYTINKELGI